MCFHVALAPHTHQCTIVASIIYGSEWNEKVVEGDRNLFVVHNSLEAHFFLITMDAPLMHAHIFSQLYGRIDFYFQVNKTKLLVSFAMLPSQTEAANVCM